MKDEQSYQQLGRELEGLDWIVNGSAVKRAPSTPRAQPTYIWTRKVKGKTVTVSLSKEQYTIFSKAIIANRKAERTLKNMRQMSARVLLESAPGVKKKTRSKKRKT